MNMKTIDHREYQFKIPEQVLTETLDLLAEPGRLGFEAVVVWIGVADDAGTMRVTHPVRPEQHSVRLVDGSVGVTIPPHAITDLVRLLDADSLVVARLHTHPSDAYHSHVDDTNMLISHPGAISIVVPNYASSVSFEDCSVYELEPRGWRPLFPDEVGRRFHFDS